MPDSEAATLATAETLRLHVDPSVALTETLRHLYRPGNEETLGKLTLRSSVSLRVVNRRGTYFPENSHDPSLANHLLEYPRAIGNYRLLGLPLKPYMKVRQNPRGLVRVELAALPLDGHRKAIEKLSELALLSPDADTALPSLLVYTDIMPHQRVDDLGRAVDALRKRLQPAPGRGGWVHDTSLYVNNPRLKVAGEPYALPRPTPELPRSA